MKQDRRVNLAEIARTYNIKYSMLYQRVHSGLSLDDAITVCEQARDARKASGRSRVPSSYHVPITFNGENYASFAEACHSVGLSEQTGYVQRKRIMDREGISKEAAALKVLQAATEHPPAQRFKKPITVLGVTYESQNQAARELNIPLGSIAAKRAREHLSIEAAIESLYSQKQADNALTYRIPFSGQIWKDLQPLLQEIFPQHRYESSVLIADYRLTDELELFCEVFMPDAQCLSFRFRHLNFISPSEINSLSAVYYGIKFILNESEEVEALSDIILGSRLKSNKILIQNAWTHCCAVLLKLYSQKSEGQEWS